MLRKQNYHLLFLKNSTKKQMTYMPVIFYVDCGHLTQVLVSIARCKMMVKRAIVVIGVPQEKISTSES